MTSAERISALHSKMADRRLEKAHRRGMVLGLLIGLAVACLIFAFADHVFMDQRMATAEGYVLTALAAFIAGAILTVLARNLRDRQPAGAGRSDAADVFRRGAIDDEALAMAAGGADRQEPEAPLRIRYCPACGRELDEKGLCVSCDKEKTNTL